MLLGYSALARELNRRLDFGRLPVVRQNIYTWNRRRVVNQLGQMFPSPDSENTHAAVHRPRLLWEPDTVIAWCLGGVPKAGGQGWKMPSLREQSKNQVCLHQQKATEGQGRG